MKVGALELICSDAVGLGLEQASTSNYPRQNSVET